jgi:thiamine biosynthesis protein ThiI
VIAELLTKVQSKFRGIILKRLFLQVANKIATNEEYYALIKGDSLGEVSSQTLKNMFVIDKASETLVLRPLISHNKQEIVDISRKIGTYNFACNMPEYCGVISDNPATGAKLEKVEKEETFFNYNVLDAAFEGREIIKIDEVIQNITDNNIEVEVVHLPGENEVIIDIREEEKKNKDPLKLEKIEITEVPFFEINHSFKDLDQTKTYLFYCDKGVLSNLHALYLKEK